MMMKSRIEIAFYLLSERFGLQVNFSADARCTLGISIISQIFLAASLTKFISVKAQENLSRTITSLLILLVFIIFAFCLIYYTINLDPHYAYVGLLMYPVIFYFYIVDNLLFISFVAFGIINPLGNNYTWNNILLLNLLIYANMFVYLYFFWVCYSY